MSAAGCGAAVGRPPPRISAARRSQGSFEILHPRGRIACLVIHRARRVFLLRVGHF